MQIEFTDRYGDHTPSWLRSCHGDCEAMGVIPTLDDSPWATCPDCKGTGRVSWFTSIRRIPRWIWKGLPFLRWAMRRDVNPPEWSAWKRFTTALWCCWGADLARLRN